MIGDENEEYDIVENIDQFKNSQSGAEVAPAPQENASDDLLPVDDEGMLDPESRSEVEAEKDSHVSESQLSAMVNEMQTIAQGIASLERGFAAKIKYDAGQKETIATLHKELQNYRDGLVFKIMKPILNDLIRLYDDVGRLVDGESGQASADVDRMWRNLNTFQASIEDILNRYGVESYTVSGDDFDG
ncbi:MAG: hypothetical protein KDE09_14580, partial [Anaerolineales bacterium]|nr:hypothetical protein [Anaerolineales bacterium]